MNLRRIPMVFGKKYGNFKKGANTIGVELETSLVDEETFEKPVETDAAKAMLNSMENMKKEMRKGMAALKGVDSRQRRKYRQSLDVISLYEKLLTDPEYEVPASKLDFLKALSFDEVAMMRLMLRYCITDFRGVVERYYNQYLESGVEDRGLSAIMGDSEKDFDNEEVVFDGAEGLGEMIRAAGGMVASFMRPFAEAAIGHQVGSAYSEKLLKAYAEIESHLTEEEREHITYDASDAIEMKTAPREGLSEIRQDLLGYYERIRPFLLGMGLKVLFAARVPDAQPMGWVEHLGRGEPQNNCGLHVHFGRLNDEFEAAYVYEVFRRVAPEIVALTANSAVSGGELGGAVCERQNFYRNLIPESLDVKPKMNREERKLLHEQMKAIFGEAARYQDRSQYELGEEIQELLTGGASVDLSESPLGRFIKEKEPAVRGSRGYSCVFVRPEFGTVEVRMIDLQTAYGRGSLEDHIDANMHAIELVDTIGRAAVDAFREGREFILEKDGLDERYEHAIRYGLFDPELKEGARDLLSRLEGHLSEETYREFSERVETCRIPAVRQIEIFKTSGREGLYKAMTTR